ncbi:MAG: 50S ribosomal protein L4 [Candidatus Helarchaeota archaeon]
MEKKAAVFDLTGKKVKDIALPSIFNTQYRPWVIRRAVIASQANRKQPQGRDPMAGRRTSAESRGPGHGISRVPRVKGTGTSRAGAGAFIPGSVGGRLAFPPKAEKVIKEKINKKERRLAIASAIASTGNLELVKLRGHKMEENVNVPIIVEDELESLTKTKEIKEVLEQLGLEPDLERAARKKVRAGKGKMRGRKYKRRRSVLIVTGGNSQAYVAARNIPGVDIKAVTNLSAEDLAPGTHAGRLTVYTESAIKKLENLFS